MALSPAERAANYRARHGLVTGKPPGRPTPTYERKLVNTMLAGAKYRAKRDGLPFTITHSDVHIPDLCPVRGTVLCKSATGRVSNASPSLDKVIPALGYVPGNVRVISSAANRLKDSNTIETLEKLLAYCRGEI